MLWTNSLPIMLFAKLIHCAIPHHLRPKITSGTFQVESQSLLIACFSMHTVEIPDLSFPVL